MGVQAWVWVRASCRGGRRFLLLLDLFQSCAHTRTHTLAHAHVLACMKARAHARPFLTRWCAHSQDLSPNAGSPVAASASFLSGEPNSLNLDSFRGQEDLGVYGSSPYSSNPMMEPLAWRQVRPAPPGTSASQSGLRRHVVWRALLAHALVTVGAQVITLLALQHSAQGTNKCLT